MRIFAAIVICLVFCGSGAALFEAELGSAASPALAEAVAAVVWKGRSVETEQFQQGLFDGLQQAAQGNLAPGVGDDYCPSYELVQEAEYHHHATVNYAASRTFFEGLPTNADLQEVVEGGVYYQVVNEGSGEPIPSNPSIVELHYRVEPIGGTASRTHPYADTRVQNEPVREPVANLLPALTHAMVGMQRGEVRRIYVHPDYGYGCRETFEPGVSLLIVVELVDFEEGEGQLPGLAGGRLPGPEREVTQEDLERAQYEAGFAEGQAVWAHFGRAEFLSGPEMLAALERLSQGEQISIPQDEALDLYSKLQCYLYGLSSIR